MFVKKIILTTLVVISLVGCASTHTTNTSNCIEVANSVENNSAKSGDDVFKECLDKKYQKETAKKGWVLNSLEGILFFLIDMTTS